jgi:hypothetical protein
MTNLSGDDWAVIARALDHDDILADLRVGDAGYVADHLRPEADKRLDQVEAVKARVAQIRRNLAPELKAPETIPAEVLRTFAQRVIGNGRRPRDEQLAEEGDRLAGVVLDYLRRCYRCHVVAPAATMHRVHAESQAMACKDVQECCARAVSRDPLKGGRP